MTVKSQHLDNGQVVERGRKQSAIVSRAALDQQRGAFERFSALAVLLLSFAGTIAALSGGWAALIATPRIAPIAGGFAIQGALTAAQWWYGAGRGRYRYRTALLVDSGLTTAGYGPLVVPSLAVYLATKVAGDVAVIGAWVIVGIVAALIAWYPEKVLID